MLYLIKRAMRLDYKSIPLYVARVRERCDKGRAAVYFDMLRCALRYGAGYVDYTIFGMYALNSEQRAQLITRGHNNTLVALLNPREHRHILSNKSEFMQRFAGSCGREFLDLTAADDEALGAFAARYPEFVAKPMQGSCGQGVERYSAADFADIPTLRRTLGERGQTHLEPPIEQHERLRRLHGESVNTLRLVTLLDDKGRAHIVFGCIRIGTGGSAVDNFNSGGISALLDLEGGCIRGRATNKAGRLYEQHPDSGVPLDGYELPYFSQCRSLVLDAARSLPELRYVGWDVAITPQGAVLVEGNEFPGHDLYQLAGQDCGGLLPEFRRLLGPVA